MPATGTPILHGPPSEAEQKETQRQRLEDERNAEERAFKVRQTNIADGQLVTNTRLARYTLWLVLFGFIGNGIAAFSSFVAKKSADAAAAAANAAQETLKLTTRADVSIDSFLLTNPPVEVAKTVMLAVRQHAGSVRSLQCDRALIFFLEISKMSLASNETPYRPIRRAPCRPHPD
jgi:hypothetical protein